MTVLPPLSLRQTVSQSLEKNRSQNNRNVCKKHSCLMLIKMPALSFGGGVKKFATSQAGPLCTPPSPLPCCPPTHIDSPSWQLCLPGWTAAVEILLFPSSFFLCLCFLCCPRIVPVALALRRQMDENVKPNCGQFSGAGEGGRQQKVEGTKVPS